MTRAINRKMASPNSRPIPSGQNHTAMPTATTESTSRRGRRESTAARRWRASLFARGDDAKQPVLGREMVEQARATPATMQPASTHSPSCAEDPVGHDRHRHGDVDGLALVADDAPPRRLALDLGSGGLGVNHDGGPGHAARSLEALPDAEPEAHDAGRDAETRCPRASRSGSRRSRRRPGVRGRGPRPRHRRASHRGREVATPKRRVRVSIGHPLRSLSQVVRRGCTTTSAHAPRGAGEARKLSQGDGAAIGAGRAQHLDLGSGHEACGRHVGGGRFCIGGKAVWVLSEDYARAPAGLTKRAPAHGVRGRSEGVVRGQMGAMATGRTNVRATVRPVATPRRSTSADRCRG